MSARARTRSWGRGDSVRAGKDTPLRLKELEPLEKVGRIDLHATGQGQGLEAILKSLFRIEGDKIS